MRTLGSAEEGTARTGGLTHEVWEDASRGSDRLLGLETYGTVR